MGQEIVYCFKCQTRILGSDFDRGAAYRVGEQAACAECAKPLLGAAEAERPEALIATERRAVAPKPLSDSSRARASTRPSTVRRAAAAGPKPALLIAGGVGAAALLLAIVALVASGPSGDSAPDPSPVLQKPNAPAAALPSEREKAAQAALEAARAHAREKPQDLDGQIRLYEKVAWEFDKTPAAEEARAALAPLAARRKEAVQRELAALLEAVRASAAHEEFRMAADLLQQSRKRHVLPEWTAPIDAEAKAVGEKAAALFGPLRDEAVQARRRGDGAKAAAAVARVAKWGMKEYVEGLEKALGAVPVPVLPRENGVLLFRIAEATIVGKKLKRTGEGDAALAVSWSNKKEYVEWGAVPKAGGVFTLELNYSCPKENGGQFALTLGTEKKVYKVEPTAGWGDYKTVSFGSVTVPSGPFRLAVQPAEIVGGALMQLRFVKLSPAK